MVNEQQIRVTAVGHIAAKALLDNHFANVTGTTAQGIFLQPGFEDQILFLTREIFRSPLTINVKDAQGALNSIQPMDQIIIN